MIERIIEVARKLNDKTRVTHDELETIAIKNNMVIVIVEDDEPLFFGPGRRGELRPTVGSLPLVGVQITTNKSYIMIYKKYDYWAVDISQAMDDARIENCDFCYRQCMGIIFDANIGGNVGVI